MQVGLGWEGDSLINSVGWLGYLCLNIWLDMANYRELEPISIICRERFKNHISFVLGFLGFSRFTHHLTYPRLTHNHVAKYAAELLSIPLPLRSE